MGRIGTLPRGFARLSPYRTPSVAIIVHNVAALVIAIGLGLLFGVTTAFGLIGTILTLGLLLLYFASCVSSFLFYRLARPTYLREFHHAILPVIPALIPLSSFPPTA